MDGNQRWYHYKYAQNVFNVELLRGLERNEWELVDACFGYQISFVFPCEKIWFLAYFDILKICKRFFTLEKVLNLK